MELESYLKTLQREADELSEALTELEADDVYMILTSKAFKKLMRQLQVMHADLTEQAANSPLETTADVANASRLRGRREGIMAAIEALFSMVADAREQTEGEVTHG